MYWSPFGAPNGIAAASPGGYGVSCATSDREAVRTVTELGIRLAERLLRWLGSLLCGHTDRED